MTTRVRRRLLPRWLLPFILGVTVAVLAGEEDKYRRFHKPMLDVPRSGALLRQQMTLEEMRIGYPASA